MGYDEFKEAREKRAEIEAATKAKGKGKHGQKRISAAPEEDASGPKPKAARVSEESKSTVARTETKLQIQLCGCCYRWQFFVCV